MCYLRRTISGLLRVLHATSKPCGYDCFSRRTISGLLRVLHATSKPCVAIIVAGFMPGALRKATLSLGVFSPPRVQTS